MKTEVLVRGVRHGLVHTAFDVHHAIAPCHRWCDRLAGFLRLKLTAVHMCANLGGQIGLLPLSVGSVHALGHNDDELPRRLDVKCACSPYEVNAGCPLLMKNFVVLSGDPSMHVQLTCMLDAVSAHPAFPATPRS